MSADFEDDYGSEQERYTIYRSERKKADNADYQYESYKQDTMHSSGYPVIGTNIVDLAEKVIVPVEEFPNYNFLGKILGPKGSTLKNIATSTKSRISILGQGSSKDFEMEEKLRQSDDPEHQHLKEPLHVLIQLRAPCIIAHERMSKALKEINKYMTPSFEKLEQSNGSRNLSPLAAGGGPILRYGIPPPGAIIIGQPNAAIEKQIRQQLSPRSGSTQDSKKYRPADDRSYNEYTDVKSRGTVRGDYPLKKYREETFSREKDSFYAGKYSSRR